MLNEQLQKYFGHASFRPGQQEVISRIMEGRNVLGLLATGGGKSVTYQLPALLLPGITVVISPLISLMMDQVQQLRARKKIPATYLNSSLDPAESREILKEIGEGAYKIVYVSPEKLQQPYVQAMFRRAGVSLVAIDEAHCISQWGHDFRTDYQRLPDGIRQLGNPPVLAVTATATSAVREEIRDLLSIDAQDVVVQALNRANIALDVIPASGEGERRKQVMEMMDRLQGPGVVYCSTRQAVDVLVASYQLDGGKRVHGYHGGMNSMERMLIQSQFLNGELDVIVATNAFGMGIDKADIRYVIHYQLPASMEAYAQEIGRVGRDGQPGYAALFYVVDDVNIHNHMLEREYPTQAQVQQFCQLLSSQTPITNDILASIGMTEEMAHLLYFYAEQAGLLAGTATAGEGYPPVAPQAPSEINEWEEQIWQGTQKRKRLKRQKLSEMVTYVVEGETCLRKSVNSYFGENEQGYTRHCCCRCGLDKNDYLGAVTVSVRKDQENSWNLRQALTMLLPKR